jgi:hypothetical protein
MAQLGEPPATTAHRYPTLSDPFLDLGQTGLEVLKPALFLEPLHSGLVAPHPPAALSPRLPDWDRQARPDPGYRKA